MKKLSYFPLNCFINWVFPIKTYFKIYFSHIHSVRHWRYSSSFFYATKIAFKIDLNSLENESPFANLNTFHSHSFLYNMQPYTIALGSSRCVLYSTYLRAMYSLWLLAAVYSFWKLNSQFSFVRWKTIRKENV